jgi:hypothetical protein
MHKGDGPELPYQAVVIRQSAMHPQGRNAIVPEGGVDPHAGSGPVPQESGAADCRSNEAQGALGRMHVAGAK